MKILPRDPSDIDQLKTLVWCEKNAKQRDRLRAVLLALEGQDAPQIARALGRARRFVQRWAYAYRDGGIAAVKPGQEHGPAQEAADGSRGGVQASHPRRPERGRRRRVHAARGRCAADPRTRVRREVLARRRVRADASAGALVPEPTAAAPQKRPAGDDPVGRGRPPFVEEVKQKHADKKVEVWVQDEARIGQQGTLTKVWAEKGSRPTTVKQTEYEWAYLFAAVNPVTGASSAMITPTVNTQHTNAHLRFISEEAGPATHVVLMLDQAGWHVAGALDIPEKMTLLHLPPYSPELNGAERVWGFLRSHYLSNRVYKNYDEIFEAIKEAWNKLTPERLASITHTDWISRTG